MHCLNCQRKIDGVKYFTVTDSRGKQTICCPHCQVKMNYVLWPAATCGVLAIIFLNLFVLAVLITNPATALQLFWGYTGLCLLGFVGFGYLCLRFRNITRLIHSPD